MAIELITGLPGNAKTLRTIEMVIKRSTEDQRPVFYAGLKEFLVGDPRLNGIEWSEIDATKWHEVVPSGGIILIDEAQKVFRSRTLGTVPGKHVTELEEHRHKGIDFYMITQHPSLIDPAIRKLTQTHHHMMRIWGMEASTIHTWNGIKDNPDKTRTDSEKTKWAFKKELYGIYKSADQHTMKRKIPGRVKMLAGLVVVFGVLVWYAGGFISKKFSGQSAQAPAAGVNNQPGRPSAPAGAATGGGAEGVPFDPVADAVSYSQQATPRVVGLPHTAPKYDQITQPTRAPVPAACIQIGAASSRKPPRCKCYTQAGTPMELEYNMCIQIAQNGYFLDFDPDRRAEGAEAMERGRQVLSQRPDTPPPDRVDAPRVVAFDLVPDDAQRVTGRPK